MNVKDKEHIEKMTDPFYEIANAINKLANVNFDCFASYEVGQALGAVGRIADSLDRIADALENQ